MICFKTTLIKFPSSLNTELGEKMAHGSPRLTTIESIVEFTKDRPGMVWAGRFQDANGLINGSSAWYRCLCALQNAPGGTYGVSGMLICANEENIWYVEINGNGAGTAYSLNKHIIAYKDMLEWSNITGKPSTFTPAAHNQDWSTITGKPSTFAPSSHTHDDRYFTETEINSKLNGKLDKSGGTITGNLTQQGHQYMSYNKKIIWNNNGQIWSSGAQQLFIGASSDSKYILHLGVHDNMWALDPDVNGNLNLGTGNHKFGTLYAVNGTIATSDRNQKNTIQPLDDRYIQLFLKLLPVSFKFNNGTSGRTHIGFISQDVEAAMQEVGLSDLEFAGFCRDQKTVPVQKTTKVKVLNEKNGEETWQEITYTEDEPVEGEYVYSLRYEEFIALNTAVIQSLIKRVETLEKHLNNN